MENAEEIMRKLNIKNGERFRLYDEKLKLCGSVCVITGVYDDYIEVKNEWAFPYEAIRSYDLEREQMIELENEL